MTTIDPRTLWLVQAARSSAAAWHAESVRAFVGEATAETANTLYRFRDGIFCGRAHRALGGPLEAPRAMQGVRLLGFLTLEDGWLAMSTHYRPGACAVLWKPGVRDEEAFLVTSTVVRWLTGEPEPSPWVDPAPLAQSGVRRKPAAPAIARPAPPSMTRIHASALPAGAAHAVSGRG